MGAIAFYTAVFGATQKALMPSPDGLRIMHCELSINGAAVMLADAFPEFCQTRPPIPGEPVTMSVSPEFESKQQVEDVFAKATSLGGKGDVQPMSAGEVQANAGARAGFTIERGWENWCREVNRPYYAQDWNMGAGFSKTDK